MVCLLAQLQKKLQLDYKTNITQKHHKIELKGSPTTKELKKPHSSRWVEGAEMCRHAERCRDAQGHRDVEQVVPSTCGE